MNREQIAWYLTQYKTFEKLKSASLKAGKPSDPQAYATLKAHIDKACVKLGIAMLVVPRERSTFHSVSDATLFLRAELKEYERRLLAVPVTMAQKAQL
jgi:hypothetical protein